MRLIHLPAAWTILVDVVAWFVIHVGVVWWAVRIPLQSFDPEGWLFQARPWEEEGTVYRRYLRINAWKQFLPDGAPLLGSRGFPKRRLQARTPEYLRTFVKETCRAELTHGAILLFAPLFFLWNRPGVGFFMIFYALAENLPLIIAQRYNRARLRRIVKD